MSKQVENFTCILAHIFNSASRQHCEVWALKFPFFIVSRMLFLSSEACLYDHVNCSHAQAQQQSCIGLSQSFLSERGGKAKPWTGFHFTVQKRPVPGSGGAFLAKRPHLESGTETQLGGKKSAGSDVCSSADVRKKGGHGGWHS